MSPWIKTIDLDPDVLRKLLSNLCDKNIPFKVKIARTCDEIENSGVFD